MVDTRRILKPRTNWLLNSVEVLGNRLPEPPVIFVALMVLLILTSLICAAFGVSVVNPSTGETVYAKSLLSAANVRTLLSEMPKTFSTFPPLGMVMVIVFGASVAEKTGLFSALMHVSLAKVPQRLLSPCVILFALLAHSATDAAQVVFIPLAGFIFYAAGRHPVAGIAAAFAGVSGGLVGNLFPNSLDVMLLGISAPAAQLIDPSWVMNPMANWWYTLAAAVLFTLTGWVVTDRIVEPRLGPWNLVLSPVGLAGDASDQGGDRTRRGLQAAGLVALGLLAVWLTLSLWPSYRPLIDAEAVGGHRVLPLYSSLVAFFFLLFLLCGWTYGRVSGKVSSHRQVFALMAEGVRDMAPYLVLVFFAAHFVALFAWSNLGPVLAVWGAGHLRALHASPGLLLVALTSVSSLFDMLIASASAKWSIIAPIVVPMFMMLGVSPDMTTAAYRMGDSVTNIISPLNVYLTMTMMFCRRWIPDFGLGSMIVTMLPYAMAFFVAGFALTATWATFDLPPGPDAQFSYSLPAGR